jgi:hypothetical protein
LKYKAKFTGAIITGTSTKGPITVVNVSLEFIPNTGIAAAIASSKLLLSTVNDSVAVYPYIAPDRLLSWLQYLFYRLSVTNNCLTFYSVNKKC